MSTSSNRTSHVIKSSIFGIIGFIVTYIFTFVTRTLFIIELGKTYLGIQGLFSNILSLLTLTELGLGSAIMFSLYKPVAVGDETKIKQLMVYYKKAYRIITFVILLVGLALLPFLDMFLNERPNIPESLEIIYLLYVANTILSYVFVYKQSLIKANQKNYIVSIYTSMFILFRDVVQIIVLVIYKDFYAFLIVQLVFTFITNIALSIKANQMYPYIRKTAKMSLDQTTKKDINIKIKSMFLYRIGAFVVTGTDNILISKFVGLIYVGIYSNYYVIISLVKTITNYLTVAFTPSVGHIVSTTNIDDVKKVFYQINFIIFWVFSLASVGLYLLINPFIELWIGSTYLLDSNIVILLIVNFFLYGMHQNMLIFRNALGLYVQAKWKPVFEAIINLIASLIFLKYFGLIGVFIGTTISFITTALWIEPYVLYKYYLGDGLNKYFTDYIIFILITFTSIVITSQLLSFLEVNNVINFIISFIIVIVVHNVLVYLLCNQRADFRELIKRLKILLKQNIFTRIK